MFLEQNFAGLRVDHGFSLIIEESPAAVITSFFGLDHVVEPHEVK